MLKFRLVSNVLKSIKGRRSHSVKEASKAEEECEERLQTDDLFFASENFPFTTLPQSDQIFPKAKPTLLDPLIDETLRVDKSGVCAVPFSQIPTLGGSNWIKMCNLFGNYLPNFEGQLGRVYPFKTLFNFCGPLVRIVTPQKNSVVLLCKPKHIASIQKYDGVHPLISVIDSIEDYRENNLSISMPQYEIDFSQVAEKYKNHLNHTVDDYQFLCNQMALNFIQRNYVIRDHSSQVPDNYNAELILWSLKSFSAIIFGRDAEYKEDGYKKIVSTLIEVSHSLNSWISRDLHYRFDILEALLVRNLRMTYLKLGKLSREVKSEASQFALIETMILKDKMSSGDIITTLLDLLVVGVNSIANLTGLVLYYLSKHPDVQDRLYWEVNLVIPHDVNELFPEDMENLPFLKACIIETIRLWPPFNHTVRRTSKEIVINGYKIPKNINLVMAHEIAYHKDEHFADAGKFEPRRWIRRTSKLIDPLEVMPFSHRQHPIIKELAYRQISILVAHMVKNFEIEYNYGEMKYRKSLLSVPSKPFRFTLKDRH